MVESYEKGSEGQCGPRKGLNFAEQVFIVTQLCEIPKKNYAQFFALSQIENEYYKLHRENFWKSFMLHEMERKKLANLQKFYE